MHQFIKATILLLLLVASSMLINGQGETTSAVVGTVLDPAGAAISGAIVVLVSADNGMTRSAKTDSAGRFSFPQLKPGRML